jgi:hypothetical protein
MFSVALAVPATRRGRQPAYQLRQLANRPLKLREIIGARGAPVMISLWAYPTSIVTAKQHAAEDEPERHERQP